MMNRSLVLTAALFLVSVAGWSAKVTIQGTAPGHESKRLVVSQVVNFLTYDKKEVFNEVISEDGSFSFKVNVDKTQLFQFQIEGVYAELIVQPGKEYSFTIPGISYVKVRRLFDNQVSLFFDDERDLSNINVVVANYDEQLEALYASLAVDIGIRDSRVSHGYYQSRPELQKAGAKTSASDTTLIEDVQVRKKIEGFRKGVENLFGDMLEDDFFAAYVEYSLAGLEVSAGLSKENVYRDHLKGKPVLYHHPEYMDFFRIMHGSLFASELSKGNTTFTRGVNSIRKPELLLEAMMSMPQLGDDKIVKMALIVNLQNIYHQKGWSQVAVEEILKKCSEMESFSAQRDLINSVLKKVKFGHKGQKVDTYKMLNHNEEWTSNNDWKGKYVYYGFFTSWSGACEEEMLIQKKLTYKYKNEIEFVSISLDENYSEFKDFVAGHPDFEWTFLYGPSEKNLRELFAVNSLPHYILVDPNGVILFDYTRKPSEGVNLTIDKLVSRSNGKKKIKVWDD